MPQAWRLQRPASNVRTGGILTLLVADGPERCPRTVISYRSWETFHLLAGLGSVVIFTSGRPQRRVSFHPPIRAGYCYYGHECHTTQAFARHRLRPGLSTTHLPWPLTRIRGHEAPASSPFHGLGRLTGQLKLQRYIPSSTIPYWPRIHMIHPGHEQQGHGDCGGLPL